MTAALSEHILVRPADVLPDVRRLARPVSVDTETTGLYVDNGDRVAAVSVSLMLDDGTEVDYAFPFDQGRHEEKGFEIQRYRNGIPRGWEPSERWADTKAATGYNTPKFDADVWPGLREEIDAWLAEWTADYNLGLEDWITLMEWLVAAGRQVGLTFQNASFDLLMIDAGTRVRDAGDGGGYPGYWLEPYALWDTMLVSKNLWPQYPTGLKPTGERLWGAEAVEDAVELKLALLTGKKLFGLRAEDGPRYDLVPWRINGKYAATDTRLTFRLRELQYLMLEDGYGQGWAVFNREHNLMRVLTRMSRRGFGPYSVAESHEWANVIGSRMAEILPALPFVRLGSVPSDKVTPEMRAAWAAGTSEPPVVSASAARASEYYFEVKRYTPWKISEQPRGFELKKKGAGGAPKFVRGDKADKAEVARRFPDHEVTFKQGELTATIAERMGELLYAEYLRLKIANQMFYRNYAELAGPDKQVRTTYRQAFVKSGRMSVERFQAQAMPKKLDLLLNGHRVPEPRAFFGVAPGRCRVNLDLSQAELRIGSHAVGSETMSHLLDTGSDLHGETCKRLFGLTEDHPDWKAKRDISKRANFGLIFNMGAVTFRKTLWNQAQLEMSLAELKEIVDGWRALYPEFGTAWTYWYEYAQAYNHVVLVNGERSWFTRTDYPNTALNRVIQGSLAAWVSEWLTLVEQVTEKHDALVLTVHDSAVLDLPIDVADEVTDRVVELSTELWVDRFGYPGKVDADRWTYHEGVDLLVPASIHEKYPAALECPPDEDPEFEPTYQGALA